MAQAKHQAAATQCDRRTETAFVPDPFEHIIGETIEYMLAVRGIPIADAAKWLEKSEGYVNDMVRGLRPWAARDILLLSQLLRVSTDEILDTRGAVDPDGEGVSYWW